MTAAERTALINTLAANTAPVPLDQLDIQATDLAEMHKDGLVAVAWTPEGNVVSLTPKGLGTIPPGKSLTPAQHAVLTAIADAESEQLPTTALYGLETAKVNPAVLLEMVSRKWIALEYVEANGETPAAISVTLGGKDGKTGRTALEYPVRAGIAKPAGSPRTGSSGQPVEHLPIPQTFTKRFKDRDFTLVSAGDSKVTVDGLGDGKPMSLTAAAKLIQATVNGKSGEVNGWAFFGLVK
jgi:hypothetical protein